MLPTAIICFLFAAMFGAILLTAILKNKRPPRPIALMHGGVAGIAILILATYVAMGHTDTLLVASLIIFVLAAMGGLTMFMLDIKHKSISKVIAIVHPLVAITGLTILITYLIKTL